MLPDTSLGNAGVSLGPAKLSHRRSCRVGLAGCRPAGIGRPPRARQNSRGPSPRAVRVVARFEALTADVGEVRRPCASSSGTSTASRAATAPAAPSKCPLVRGGQGNATGDAERRYQIRRQAYSPTPQLGSCGRGLPDEYYR